MMSLTLFRQGPGSNGESGIGNDASGNIPLVVARSSMKVAIRRGAGRLLTSSAAGRATRASGEHSTAVGGVDMYR